MAGTFSVNLNKIIKEFSLETLFLPGNPQELLVTSSDINRPGLQLTGFYEYFDNTRIQVIGKSEFAFLDQLEEKKRVSLIETLLSRKPPIVILTRGLEPFPEILSLAPRYGVPVCRMGPPLSSPA